MREGMWTGREGRDREGGKEGEEKKGREGIRDRESEETMVEDYLSVQQSFLQVTAQKTPVDVRTSPFSAFAVSGLTVHNIKLLRSAHTHVHTHMQTHTRKHTHTHTHTHKYQTFRLTYVAWRSSTVQLIIGTLLRVAKWCALTVLCSTDTSVAELAAGLAVLPVVQTLCRVALDITLAVSKHLTAKL